MDSSEQAYVLFDKVEKTYDGKTNVIKQLDLAIKRGEFLTMLGPSGSGKTTCLMMLAGFQLPTKGVIYLNNRPITHVAPYRRNIGFVFQNYALFPHLTVAENLAYPLKARKMEKREIASRVAKVLAMVQLSDFGNRRPNQLSGGQQQRVAVARALVFDPELVLMDEPLGALDKQLRERMQLEIRHLHEMLGVTIVYVTHDQSEALTMSDRIAVFNEGEIQQLDVPQRLYERPANAFVAQFIGENNMLKAAIEKSNNGQSVAKIAGSEDTVAVTAMDDTVTGAGWLAVRPEALQATKEENPPDFFCQAKIADVIYHGDHVRLLLKNSGGQEIVVKLRGSQQLQSWQMGQNVSLTCKVEDRQAFNHADF